MRLLAFRKRLNTIKFGKENDDEYIHYLRQC